MCASAGWYSRAPFFGTPHARAHTRTLMSKLIKPLDNGIALITVTLLSPYLGLAGITTQQICSERTANTLSRATPDIIKISHWEGKY